MSQDDNICSLCFRYAMKELTLFEAKRFSRHLQRCERCQLEYIELRKIRSHVEHEFAQAKPTVVRRHQAKLARWQVVIATTAALVVIGMVLPNHHRLLGHVREGERDVYSGITRLQSAAHEFVHAKL